MIHEPPIDELVQKMGSKYALCVIASKRARQIIEQSQSAVATEPLKEKPLSMAAKEIQDGKLIISND
ncbi:MAG: DNA-directed RNA polymerase subunit omega [Clostridiales bacterium]|nr:DNA-directed RNA polymerase subunit omega [Clostridiales bacterium]